jgi:putative transposase
MLQDEMTNHLGYEKNEKGKNPENSRNGKTKKNVTTEFGGMEIEVPRDRTSEFEPKVIQKGQRRFKGFDDKIIAMYARGMTTREIQAYLQEIYNYEVSPDLISDVTEEVMKEVIEWQNRTIDSLYLIMYFDAIMVKIRDRDNGHLANKAVYLALGVNLEGKKELLGMWIEQTEGAKFWLKVLTELKNRGLNDILIACVDGLKGFEEAIHTVYPMVRNSLKYVSYKDRKAIAADLRLIYNAVTEEEISLNLANFREKWDNRYQSIGKSREANWTKIVTCFAYPADIRRAVYTTNAIESVNMNLRKVIKNRASFPTDEAALKLLFLALRNISKKWTMPIHDWGKAMNQFALHFGDRVQL